MTAHTTSPEPEFTDLLRDLYGRLVQIEQTIGTLADSTPDGFIMWGFPQAEAAEARDALGSAPSLAGFMPPPAELTDTHATAESLADLTTEIHRTLITASAKATDSADRHACLSAAMFAGRLHESLR
ncbi:hypothetical protein SAMN04489712_10213 [Thermomonospora echinospora]|uniref:Uncharacterized protein n=1 Tax=Thermomonospora echinospora TaxID=1992 RepID=A0A1H5UT98_9ACTN|nr:hypothetical protein [Thermomonospora echinospora]SEF78269.1 hypothetical protein SAMN04489712_10213 [Thermomonospora echinospora]